MKKRDWPNKNIEILPNLFLMGAAKSATTTIASIVSQHPKILLSYKKETNFFQKDYYQKGMQWYSKEYFRGANKEKYFMDASPEYMIMKYVLPRIKESCDDPKFIFIFREPTERAYFSYKMKSSWRPGRCCDTFEEEMQTNMMQYHPQRFRYEYERMSSVESRGSNYATNWIEHGIYYQNVMRYIEEFGRENVFIGVYDEFISENMVPQCENMVRDFLGLDYYPLEDDHRLKTGNTKKLIQICEENPSAGVIANTIYRPDIEKLSKLIDKDLISLWDYDKLEK